MAGVTGADDFVEDLEDVDAAGNIILTAPSLQKDNEDGDDCYDADSANGNSDFYGHQQDQHHQHHRAVVPQRKWMSGGVCAFSHDCLGCIDALFCPYFAYGRIAATLDSRRSRGFSSAGSSGSSGGSANFVLPCDRRTAVAMDPIYCCAPLFVDWFLLPTIGSWFALWMLRSRVRARYQLEGSDCTDCLYSATFCLSTAQLARELDAHDVPTGMCCICDRTCAASSQQRNNPPQMM